LLAAQRHRGETRAFLLDRQGRKFHRHRPIMGREGSIMDCVNDCRHDCANERGSDFASDYVRKAATVTVPPASLRLMRVPGEFGVVVRCYGELSGATTEALQRELIFLEPLDHPLLTLNLAGCHVVDLEGVRTILQSSRRLRGRGRRLVIVAGTGAIARELRMLRLDWIIPVYSTEEAAALVLRGWSSPLPGPGTWEAARAESVIHWQLIQEAVEEVPGELALRLLTSMTPLCEQAEEVFQERNLPSGGQRGLAACNHARCQCCPLFHELGGLREDVGCRSLIDPIIAAVEAGDRNAAGALIQGVIETLKEMPLPHEAGQHPGLPAEIHSPTRAPTTGAGYPVTG
jgi:anti-anti-sigma factor